MSDEEKAEVISVLANLLGFAEGACRISWQYWHDKEPDQVEHLLKTTGEFQRARALLAKLAGER